MSLEIIYKYFNQYSKEKVTQMLEMLTDEEIDFIIKRYSDKSVNSDNWSKENAMIFYQIIVPKMKQILTLLSNKKELTETNSILKDTSIKNKSVNVIIKKDDYVRLLELFKTQDFIRMLELFPIKDVIIASLKLAHINDKKFTTSSIANFLGIDNEEVINTTIKVLATYKERMNQTLDNTIESLNNEQLIKRK